MKQYHCVCGAKWPKVDGNVNVINHVDALCDECQKYDEAGGIRIKTDKDKILEALNKAITIQETSAFPTGTHAGLMEAKMIVMEMEL
uniref:Uncharacterized protein n=1 Tax=viral metagenome TaxID=1070528 RepID=A0A6H1ZWK2_9ZZZZ